MDDPKAAELPHVLERTIVIRARRDIVFGYFTDSHRWADWWGAGSTIDPVAGGAVLIRYPNGTEACGSVVEIVVPERLVFTFGYASGEPIGPGASLVTITLDDDPAGTVLHLRHAFGDASVRDRHVQGWRYQLSVFANVATDELRRHAGARIDGWLAAFAEPDAGRRAALLAEHAAADIVFRDRHSCVAGQADLVAHLDAMHRFLPGLQLVRVGDWAWCQGTAISDWQARDGAGAARGAGRSVFRLDADGRLAEVVTMWRDDA